MGNCARSVNAEQPRIVKGITDPVPAKAPGADIGIHRASDNEIVFSHAPLYRNQKLKQLFDENSKETNQLAVNFMLVAESVKVDGKLLEFSIKTQVPLRVWVVENGKEVLHPPTQLTVKFMECDSLNCNEYPQVPPKRASSFSIRAVLSKAHIDHYCIVLEQLGTYESIYLLYYFTKEPHQKYKLSKQKYDRCGLSFSVDPIYGSTHGVATADQADKCAICLDNDANTIFIPCRHMCICRDCGKILIQANNQVCPICRKPFSSLVYYNRGGFEQK